MVVSLHAPPKGMYTFPSHLVRSIVLKKLYNSCFTQAYSNFDDFLKVSFSETCYLIPHLVHSTLSPPFHHKLSVKHSRGLDDRVFERQFQCEFYRCVRTYLSPVYHCSPDVGHSFGCKGLIDFYVNSTLKWGIELWVCIPFLFGKPLFLLVFSAMVIMLVNTMNGSKTFTSLLG